MLNFSFFGRAFVPAVATAMVLATGASAQAAVTYYATEASFLAALEPGYAHLQEYLHRPGRVAPRDVRGQ